MMVGGAVENLQWNMVEIRQILNVIADKLDDLKLCQDQPRSAHGKEVREQGIRLTLMLTTQLQDSNKTPSSNTPPNGPSKFRYSWYSGQEFHNRGPRNYQEPIFFPRRQQDWQGDQVAHRRYGRFPRRQDFQGDSSSDEEEFQHWGDGRRQNRAHQHH